MSQRQSNLLCLRDLLEHLLADQQQLAWAEERSTVGLLTENMLRNLEQCRQICSDLRKRAAVGQVA